MIVPTPELPEGFRKPGQRPAEKNTRIDIVGINDKQGQKVTPAFTDLDALKTWDPNTPSLGIKAPALFQMLMGTDFQAVGINPFDPIRKMVRPGGRVSRRKLDLLAKGILPVRVIPKGIQYQLNTNQEVAIGIPAVRPSPQVEEVLRATAAGIPEISEMFLFQMATPEGHPLTVIGIQADARTPRARQDALVMMLGEAIQGKLAKGQSLDFMVLGGDFGKRITATGLSIFRRG